LGGYYLSQNPSIISDWQYQRMSKKRDLMADRLLVAPDICAGASISMFENACGKLELEYGSRDWKQGLSADEQTCLLESFREVTLYKLEYDGSPKSQLENLETDEEIILHVCGISEDVNFYRPEHGSDNAKSMLDTWYQWKHKEGNYF